MAGKSKMQAASNLDIGLATATTYEREYEQLRAKLDSDAKSQAISGVISKNALAVRLSQVIADPGTPPQYLAALSRALADIEGYNAPKSLDIHDSRPVKPISELLEAWNKERTGGAPQRESKYDSSAKSQAATDLEKSSSEPADSKALTAGSKEADESAKAALASVIVSNELESGKSDGSA